MVKKKSLGGFIINKQNQGTQPFIRLASLLQKISVIHGNMAIPEWHPWASKLHLEYGCGTCNPVPYGTLVLFTPTPCWWCLVRCSSGTIDLQEVNPLDSTHRQRNPWSVLFWCIHPSICPADGDDDDADDEGEDDYSATIKLIFIIFLCFLATVFPLFVYILWTITGPYDKPRSNQVQPGPRTSDEHDEQHRKHEAKIGDRLRPRAVRLSTTASPREIGRSGILEMGWNGITMDNNIIKLSAWMVYTKHVF